MSKKVTVTTEYFVKGKVIILKGKLFRLCKKSIKYS